MHLVAKQVEGWIDKHADKISSFHPSSQAEIRRVLKTFLLEEENKKGKFQRNDML